jgi:hypothetical protein
MKGTKMKSGKHAFYRMLSLVSVAPLHLGEKVAH